MEKSRDERPKARQAAMDEGIKQDRAGDDNGREARVAETVYITPQIML